MASVVTGVSWLLFFGSLTAIFLVFCGVPLLAALSYALRGKKPIAYGMKPWSVSHITVVHNAESSIRSKLDNSLTLTYPSEDYEIIIASDGSNDQTDQIVKSSASAKVRLVAMETHEGKNKTLNRAVAQARGDILVFSDGDTLLKKDAILQLVRHFGDPQIGGVCGKIQVYRDDKDFAEAPTDHLKFDALIKKLESDTGSLSSNTGAIHAIRKEMFRPVPPGVTDDLFNCLSVVQKKFRFVFDPSVIAQVRFLARSPQQTVATRRRVVCRSLQSISLTRDVLNPFRYGQFSIRLFVNKILRRLLPIFLAVIFLTSFYLGLRSPIMMAFFVAQAIVYGVIVACCGKWGSLPILRAIKYRIRPIYYLTIGIYGTFLGLTDFLRGKQYVKWTPYDAKDVKNAA